MGRPRKPLWPPGHRGFESHTFRVWALIWPSRCPCEPRVTQCTAQEAPNARFPTLPPNPPAFAASPASKTRRPIPFSSTSRPGIRMRCGWLGVDCFDLNCVLGGTTDRLAQRAPPGSAERDQQETDYTRCDPYDRRDRRKARLWIVPEAVVQASSGVGYPAAGRRSLLLGMVRCRTRPYGRLSTSIHGTLGDLSNLPGGAGADDGSAVTIAPGRTF